MNERGNSYGLLLRVLLVAIALAPSALTAASGPRVGEQVRDFAFTGLNGKAQHLSDFAGRYVLLDFWATWCRPCVKEIPTLKKGRQLFGGRGLEILGMNSDKDAEKARKFVEKNQIPWPQAAPGSTKDVIASALKVQWYPTMILLGPQRRILLVSGNGKTSLKGEKLLKTLDRLLPSRVP